MKFDSHAVLRVMLALALAVVPAQAQTPPPDLGHALTGLKPRVDAPALRLKDMDGKEHDLAHYRGRVVLINFWATWCPPCRREMPSLERLQQKLKGHPIVVLAVNVGETAEVVFPFLGTLDTQPTYPILLDQDGRVLKSWPVKGLPTTLVVDRNGRVSHRAIGGREFDHPALVSALERLLGER